MGAKRVDRLNSLLREVISEVIHKDLKNPKVPPLVTVTRVEITSDLQHAKVFISVIGDQKTKDHGITALQSAAGFIAHTASKKVVMRFFPELKFYLDDSVDKQMQIEDIISKIQTEREAREKNS